jgi:deoxyadenosine/deoxycytidine kinase
MNPSLVPEKKAKRGRPRNEKFKTKLEYFRDYYSNHKEKWTASHLCETCQIHCTKINMKRHLRSKAHHTKLCVVLADTPILQITNI